MNLSIYIFLVARSLRGGRGNGLATKKKDLVAGPLKRIPFFWCFPYIKRLIDVTKERETKRDRDRERERQTVKDRERDR